MRRSAIAAIVARTVTVRSAEPLRQGELTPRTDIEGLNEQMEASSRGWGLKLLLLVGNGKEDGWKLPLRCLGFRVTRLGFPKAFYQGSTVSTVRCR